MSSPPQRTHTSPMGRQTRPYLPGGFFHLVARTQARIHWFSDDVKDGIVRIIADAVEEADVVLHAFVVMDNHFHVVVRQGDMPLARFMHAVMRRTALLVKRRHLLEDHVFGGPYRHRHCTDAADLRNCIRYIHLNPRDAGCCSDPMDYPWSSHVAYARVLNQERWRPRLTVLRGLFATGSCRSESELCVDYLRFVAERGEVSEGRRRLPLHHGDAFGLDLFRERVRGQDVTPRRRMDLRDVIQKGIKDLCPELDIEMVRTFRGALMTTIRVRLVERAARAGHRGCRIAGYLQMSESQVSRVIRALPVVTAMRTAQ